MFRRFSLLLCCAVAVSCGGPDFVTVHNLGVYNAKGRTNKAQTECATSIYLRSGGAIIGRIEVLFRADKIDGYKAGIQQGSTVHVVWLAGYGSNAFYHELYHTTGATHPPNVNWPEITEMKRVYREESKCEQYYETH